MSTVLTNDKAAELRKVYEPRIQELNRLAKEIAESKEKVKDGYLVSGISKLTSMMLDCEQYETEIDPDGEAVLVDRVVKIRRYSNKEELVRHGVDSVMVAGLYVRVPLYLLPANKVKKACRNRFRTVLNPEEFGLPGHDIADYGTFREYSATAYSVVAKFHGSYANDLIRTAREYEHIFLK